MYNFHLVTDTVCIIACMRDSRYLTSFLERQGQSQIRTSASKQMDNLDNIAITASFLISYFAQILITFTKILVHIQIEDLLRSEEYFSFHSCKQIVVWITLRPYFLFSS